MSSEPKSYQITVNGVQRELSEEEVLNWASKALGADEKFRNAAETLSAAEKLRDEAQSALQWKKDLEAARTGDVDAFRRLASSWGISEQETAVMIDQYQKQQSGAQGSPQSSGGALSPDQLAMLQKAAALVSKFEKAGIDPVDEILQSKSYQGFELTSKAKDVTRKALDRDPVWRKILTGSPKGQTIFNDVWSRVERRVERGQEFSEKTIQEAAKEVRDILAAFDEGTSHERGGVHPGSLGAAPVAGSTFSRLQSPKAPDYNEFASKGDFPGYVQAKLEYENWQAANSEPQEVEN